MSTLVTCGINSPFGELSPTSRQIPHVLRTLTPLDIVCIATNNVPFDLHVLSTPPAFVLSQNQTLRIEYIRPTLANVGSITYCAYLLSEVSGSFFRKPVGPIKWDLPILPI